MFFTFRHKHRNEPGGLTAGAPIYHGVGDPRAHFGATTQPTPGAGAYAYETLGLPRYDEMGPSPNAMVRFPIKECERPLISLYAVALAGLGGIVSGQLVQQPLFNPLSGYSGFPPLQPSMLAPNVIDPVAPIGGP